MARRCFENCPFNRHNELLARDDAETTDEEKGLALMSIFEHVNSGEMELCPGREIYIRQHQLKPSFFGKLLGLPPRTVTSEAWRCPVKDIPSKVALIALGYSKIPEGEG